MFVRSRPGADQCLRSLAAGIDNDVVKGHNVSIVGSEGPVDESERLSGSHPVSSVFDITYCNYTRFCQVAHCEYQITVLMKAFV